MNERIMFNQVEHKKRILGMLDMIRTYVENSASVWGSFDFDRPYISPIYGYNIKPINLKGTENITIAMELNLILGENKG